MLQYFRVRTSFEGTVGLRGRLFCILNRSQFTGVFCGLDVCFVSDLFSFFVVGRSAHLLWLCSQHATRLLLPTAPCVLRLWLTLRASIRTCFVLVSSRFRSAVLHTLLCTYVSSGQLLLLLLLPRLLLLRLQATAGYCYKLLYSFNLFPFTNIQPFRLPYRTVPYHGCFLVSRRIVLCCACTAA